MDSEQTIERSLEALLIHDPEFQQLEASSNDFCPFEAMGVVRAEIRHASFLRTILDPYRPHRYGASILRRVLMEAVSAARDEGGSTGGLSRLDVHVLNLADVEVRREWRNIDLLVVAPAARTVFAFELKIESTQGVGQLEGYRKTVEEVWPDWTRIFVFLTKYKEVPSDKAWIPLRLARVVEVVESLLNSPGANPSARASLAAYVSMLRKHHMDNERMAKLAASIWSRHSEALEFLMERRPDPIGDLFRALRDDINAICIATAKRCTELVPDRSTGTFLRFGVKNWDDLPGFTSGSGWTPSGRILLFEITWAEGEIKAGLVLGPSQPHVRKTYMDALEQGGAYAFPKPLRKWKWLETETLFEIKEDEPFDHALALNEVKENFFKFVTDVGQRCSKAFEAVK